mgnify:FL=1
MREGETPQITVFTPTYNRAHTLPRLYESLLAQTFTEFEWLIVDDGSTDGTRDLVAGWIAEAPFPIRYIHKENGGKHTAFNLGVREAKAHLFATIDSDDVALPHTLEAYFREWSAIDEAHREHYSGVSGLCIDDKNQLVGTRYPESPMDSDLVEIRYKWHVKGDKPGCYVTSVLRAFPFQDIAGAKFIPEGIVWSRIARVKKHRFFNEVVLKIFIHETAGNQLTKIANPAVHAKSHALWHLGKLNDELGRWFKHDPISFYRFAVHYVRFSLHSGTGLIDQPKMLRTWTARCLWIAAAPLGAAVYLRDLWRIRMLEKQESSHAPA